MGVGLAGAAGLLTVCVLVLAVLYAAAPLMLFAINGKLARLIKVQERIATQLENLPSVDAAPAAPVPAVKIAATQPKRKRRSPFQRAMWLLGSATRVMWLRCLRATQRWREHHETGI